MYDNYFFKWLQRTCDVFDRWPGFLSMFNNGEENFQYAVL